jgi:Do/DeqQ family serine protease
MTALAKTSFIALVLSLGFVFGLVVSGRISSTQPASAAEPIVQQPQAIPRATAAAAVAGLPDLSPIAERAIQGSVNISSTQTYRQRNDPWMAFLFGQDPYGYTTQQAQSLGSGVIVSTDGYILTNSHVVGDVSAQIRVTLPDNRELPAKIIGIDKISDLAVVKVEAKGLTPLVWGDSSKLRVAEWVLAVGNPFAFSQTVTLGIVSAVNRHNPQLATYNDMIQTDAAINPGNSGGALVDAHGDLIGINTMIYSETGGYQGIGFAIPSNLAQKIMDELIKNGEVVHGSIGLGQLATVDPERAERAGYGRLRGVLINDLYQGTSADRAGIQPGDIVTKFNGTDITDSSQLQGLIANSPVGSTVKIEVRRETKTLTVDVQVQKLVPTVRRGRGEP